MDEGELRATCAHWGFFGELERQPAGEPQEGQQEGEAGVAERGTFISLGSVMRAQRM